MTPTPKSRLSKSRVPRPPTTPLPPADDRDICVAIDESILLLEDLSAKLYDADDAVKAKALPHLLHIRDRLGELFRSL